MKDVCPVCGEKTYPAAPPRFSPEDRYGRYRRALKLQTLREREETSDGEKK